MEKGKIESIDLLACAIASCGRDPSGASQNPHEHSSHTSGMHAVAGKAEDLPIRKRSQLFCNSAQSGLQAGILLGRLGHLLGIDHMEGLHLDVFARKDRSAM